jgi:xylulokinase
MSYLIIDFGTSSCRASIVTPEGVIISSSRKAVEVEVNGTKAEIKTDYAWDTVKTVVKQELNKNPKVIIDAIGVSSMLAYVFLDADNRPLRQSIIWMDNRAGEEAAEINNLFDIKELYRKTGRRLSPELLAPKLLWLQKHEKENFSRIRKIIGLKDEIVRRLTGIIQTDIVHLNYSLLYNVKTGQIDDDIVSALKINKDILPEGKSAEELAGTVSKACEKQTGLKTGIPVVCGSTDGTTAMYGGGILDPGKAVLVSGTTDVLMMLSDQMNLDSDCTLSINNGMLKNSFAVGGAMGTSGGTLRKILDLFNWDYEETIAKLYDTRPGADGLLFTPGLSGERAPYWAENFRGSLVGLNLSHRAEDVVRALFEGASFRLKKLLLIMQNSGLKPDSINVVGGGSEVDIYNQIRADITGIPVVSLEHSEATTLGAAVFCRMGIGEALNITDVGREWIKSRQTYMPDNDKKDKYQNLADIFENCIDKMRNIHNDLKEGI